MNDADVYAVVAEMCRAAGPLPLADGWVGLVDLVDHPLLITSNA